MNTEITSGREETSKLSPSEKKDALSEEMTESTSCNNETRGKFGCGKGIFTYVADDFDAPLSEFDAYMP